MLSKHWDWKQCVEALDNRLMELEKLNPVNPAPTPEEVKAWAAQQQATHPSYAPLRSDTKPLLELAAFARKVVAVDTSNADPYELARTLYSLQAEAKKILADAS